MVIAFQSWPSRGNTMYCRGHYIFHRDRSNKQKRLPRTQVPELVLAGSISQRPRQVYMFRNKARFTVRSYQHFTQPPNWRTTPCRHSTTAYSMYSQVPSTLEDVPASATYRRAMPCCQGRNYHGVPITGIPKASVAMLFKVT
jgi:hypothetical protein